MARFKRFVPRSLFGRSLLIIVTPLIILQVVAAYVFYERHWDNVSRHLALGLVGDITAVMKLIQAFPEKSDQAFVLWTARVFMRVDAYIEPNAVLAATAPPASGVDRYPELTSNLRTNLDRAFLVDTESDPRNVAISIQLDEGVMHVTVSRKRLFSSTTYIFILWMVGTSIVLIAVAVFFLRRQMRSIRRLAQAADGFGKGRQVPDFKAEGASEIRQAANAFLLMRERINRQIAQRTEMLAGVSHDLRTPLTRIKLHLAMLGDGEDIAALKGDIVEMEKMIDGYLAFARGEGGETPEPTDLSSLLEEVVASGRRKGSDIALESSGDMTVAVRRNALKRCFTNLIDNAQRHGEHVVVAASRRDDTVEVSIDDDGPGIPETERSEVFRAFYRLDASRNPETGGVGLGLTIARDVVRSHGGDLLLEEAPLGGVRALVRLPV
jgi:two-component system osmolarity sensor histidine kinase EnvZ